MDLQQTFLGLVFLTSLGCYINAQKAERDIDICTSMSEARSRYVHMYNPAFPDFPTNSRHCTCTVSSSNHRPLAVSIRFYLSSSLTSLIVKYEDADENITWTGYSPNYVSRDLNGAGFLITNSTNAVEVIYKSKPTLKSIFALDIGAVNTSDELKITCSQLSDSTDDAVGDDEGIIEYIESFCDSYILIVLGGVCAAFFLIIVVLAICLCCTVRKSKTAYLRHTSGTSQPLSNQSSLGLPMESYRVASRIYDDGAAWRQSVNGDQYSVPRHHSLPAVRESLAYVNTTNLRVTDDNNDMSLYGNT